MLDIYTVSFFGHRQVDNYFALESRLEEIVENLMRSKEYVEFLVGKNGEFDTLVASVIKRVQKKRGSENSSLSLVLPYKTSDISKDRDFLEAFYDSVEICRESESAHFKAAIQIRNRNMVSRSNLVIFYVSKKSGGAYQTYEWAQKSNKNIINLDKI